MEKGFSEGGMVASTHSPVDEACANGEKITHCSVTKCKDSFKDELEMIHGDNCESDGITDANIRKRRTMEFVQ